MNRLLSLLCLPPLVLAACSGCATQKDAVELPPARTPEDARLGSAVPAGDATSPGPRAAEVTVQPQPAPPTPGPESPPPALEALVPWFSPSPYAGALADWYRAAMATEPEVAASLRRQAIATLAAPVDESRAAPARFLAAWIESELALEPMARVALALRFEELAGTWPLMADVSLVKAARLYQLGGSFPAALAALDKLDAEHAPEASIHLAEAQELRASLLLATDRRDEARAHLERVAARDPSLLTADAWALLAELREGTSREAAHYELALRFPATTAGRAAFEALDRAALTPKQRVALGKVLFEAGRYDAMRAVLAGFVKPSDEACEAWVLLGKAFDRGNRKKKKDAELARRAFDNYEKALACKGAARADATFFGGKNRMAHGDEKRGKALLEAHVAEFPERSTADDARLLLAQRLDKTRKKTHKALLATLRRYPTGDMADQVAWELVSPHLEKRRWDKVLDTVDEILALAPDDVPGRHAGRYRYWRGRALAELGRVDEAIATWRQVFLRHPLSWYALLAWSRLVTKDPAIGPTLLAEAGRQTRAIGGDEPSDPTERAALEAERASAPPVDPSAEPASAIPTSLWRDAHFRRAVEWARLAGGWSEAPSPLAGLVERELDAVPKSARPDPSAWAWTRVAVHQLAGGWARSMRLARSAEATFPLPFPTEEHARRWRLAYPQPFAEYVARWAGERALPTSWVWGVMRVESNFDPSAVSWANAVGLMQIILPTAQMLVRDTSHAPTIENLMRPAIAVELGTKYLAKLLDRHKVFPLASAGYNAGGGAVSKWRRQFGDVDVDEFVERIPYREAHLYAKSVTQTLARYLWLYEGQMLTIDLSPVGHPDAAAPPTE